MRQRHCPNLEMHGQAQCQNRHGAAPKKADEASYIGYVFIRKLKVGVGDGLISEAAGLYASTVVALGETFEQERTIHRRTNILLRRRTVYVFVLRYSIGFIIPSASWGLGSIHNLTSSTDLLLRHPWNPTTLSGQRRLMQF